MLVPFNLDSLPNITCFGFVSYKEPWIHFKRNIDEYIVYIIANGELYIKEGDYNYVLKKNGFLLLQPNQVHIGFKKACCDYYFIHFKQNELPNLKKSRDEILNEILKVRSESLMSDPTTYFDDFYSMCYLPKHFHITDKSVSSHFMYSLKKSLEEYNKRSEHYRIVFSCKFIEILISISKEYIATEIEKQPSTYSRDYLKVDSIQNYINSNYTNKINSCDIEQAFNFNYDYLNRIFHRMTGHTILNYLTIVRINKAKELIEQTTSKMSEITLAVGINDAYYFSKVFKKVTGLSPLEYRKKRR